MRILSRAALDRKAERLKPRALAASSATEALADWALDADPMPAPRSVAQLRRDPEVKASLADGDAWGWSAVVGDSAGNEIGGDIRPLLPHNDGRDGRLPRGQLICCSDGLELEQFQRNLLGQHRITNGKITFRSEA